MKLYLLYQIAVDYAIHVTVTKTKGSYDTPIQLRQVTSIQPVNLLWVQALLMFEKRSTPYFQRHRFFLITKMKDVNIMKPCQI